MRRSLGPRLVTDVVELNGLGAELERVVGELPAFLPILRAALLLVSTPVREHGNARDVAKPVVLDAFDRLRINRRSPGDVHHQGVDADLQRIVDQVLEPLRRLCGVLLKVDALSLKRARALLRFRPSRARACHRPDGTGAAGKKRAARKKWAARHWTAGSNRAAASSAARNRAIVRVGVDCSAGEEQRYREERDEVVLHT